MIEYRFRLTYNGVTTEVIEPNQWGSFTSKLERDFDVHGAFFFFSDSDLRLEFAGEGRNIFKQARDNEGFNAIVTIDIDSRPDEYSAWEDEFDGTAIMENLTIDTDYAKVDFEEVTLLSNIKNRKASPIDIEGSLDFDGNTITPLTPDTITFPSFLSETSMTYAGNLGTWDGSIWDFTTNITFALFRDEIEYSDKQRAYRNESPEDGGTVANLGGRLFAPTQSENYDIELNFTGELQWSGAATPTFTPQVILRLQELNLDDGTETTLDTATINITAGSGSDTFALNHTDTIETIGYEYFIRVTLGGSMSAAPDTKLVTGQDWVFSIQTNLPSQESTSDHFSVFNALDKSLEIVTAQSNLLKSDILDSGGALDELCETNGYKLRKQTSQKYSITLDDRLDSLLNAFGLGYNLEYDSDVSTELDKFRVEPIPHFYQDTEIVEFTDIEIDSYIEEFFEDLLFNKVEIGYDDFAEDEENTALESINDYNTEAEYTLESINIESTYSKKIPAIASNILIEDTRKQQFINPGLKSWKYDSNLFFIDTFQYGGDTVPRDQTFMLTENITSKYPYNLRLNPRFCFYNHSEIVNSVFYVSNLDSKYINTKYSINNTGKIAYSNDFSNPDLGDIRQFGAINDVSQNDTDITALAYNEGLRLFDPIKIIFRVGMTATQLNNILDNHRNRGNNKYGYISVTNPDGEKVSGWLLSMSYNYVDRIGSFELIKKANNYFS